MNPVVDLRSDTVTRPTPAMRAFMASARVSPASRGAGTAVDATRAGWHNARDASDRPPERHRHPPVP